MKIASRAMLPGKSYKPKPYIFSEDFVLVIDTREQNPLCTSVKGLTICRNTLKDGDYSIRGFEDRFTVERKQTSDFFSYIGKERRRTVQKLEKLKAFDFAALVIEASLEDLFSPQLYTQVSPEVARQFFVSVNVRYGLHVYCDRSRKKIEMWLIDRAIKFFKVQREVHSA
jgi:ERCC4-type nuclease